MSQAILSFFAKGCIFLKLRSLNLFGQSQTWKLPSTVRLEKIAIGFATMSFRGCHGRPPQYHLIDHELPIVLAYRPFGFLELRIGKIGTFRPFPSMAPLDLFGSHLPFCFRWQSFATPCRKCSRYQNWYSPVLSLWQHGTCSCIGHGEMQISHRTKHS